MAHKYKIGDRVRIRKDLKSQTDYFSEGQERGWIFVDGMDIFKGKIVTIASLCERGSYEIEEYDAYWTDGMFENKPKTLKEFIEQGKFE